MAEQAVEQARERIAKLIGATAKEIIFTSGATESDNLAIKGVAEMYREKGNHIITQATEHKAVLDTCKRLEKYGFRVTYLPVQKDGRIDLDDLKRAMDDKTILVTIMTANNEIGVLQPIREIGALCHERGVLFHTDAAQAVGKVPFNVIRGQCRPGFDLGAQALRAEGRGRAVRAPQESAGAAGGADRRRRPRARHALRHAECSGHCGTRQGLRPSPAKRWRRKRSHLAALRDRLKDKIMGQLDEVYINGYDGASPAGQPEYQLRLCGRRVAADGHQRYCGVERLGLHLCDAGAILCAEGAGRGR